MFVSCKIFDEEEILTISLTAGAKMLARACKDQVSKEVSKGDLLHDPGSVSLSLLVFSPSS